MASGFETGLKPGPQFHARTRGEIQGFHFDVDNTLVVNESLGLPSRRTQQTFRNVGEQKGEQFLGVATARPFSKVEHLVNPLALHGLLIVNNGGKIIDGRNGEVVIDRGLKRQTTIELAKELQAVSFTHWVQDGGIDHFWVPGHVARKEKIWTDGLGMYERPVEVTDPSKGMETDPSYMPEDPAVLVALVKEDSEVEQIANMVRGQNDNDIRSYVAHIHPDGRKVVFVLHKLADKRIAFQEIVEKTGISARNRGFTGDGVNDIVLLDEAATAVVVDNANDNVKQHATHIAPAWDDDGAAVTLEELVLK